MSQSLLQLLYVAIGGAFGASFRFLVYEFVAFLLGKGFPFATLLVNILGSFVMGLLFTLLEKEVISLVPWRTLLGVGFLGALTTFSTFSMDSLLLLQQGDVAKALINIVLNVVLCIGAAYLGTLVYR